MNVRLTAWMSEQERAALDDMARRNNTSVNFIVRTAIRQFLGFDTSSSQLLRVTTETTKTETHA